MERAAESDLSGVWTGVYTYSHGESVTFTATLLHSGPHLSGRVHEPDTFTGGGGALEASVEGRAEGGRVSFLKRYTRTPGFTHTVDYRGAVSGDGLEIDGAWSIGGAGESGRFLMTRNGATAVGAGRRERVEA